MCLNFLVWFWLQVFVENYWNIEIWTLGTHFFKLSDYRNIKYRTGKLGKLCRKAIRSDIGYQTQTIGLSDIGYIKKTIACPALIFSSFPLRKWYFVYLSRYIHTPGTSFCITFHSLHIFYAFKFYISLYCFSPFFFYIFHFRTQFPPQLTLTDIYPYPEEVRGIFPV